MSEPRGTYYGPDLTAELAATRARLAEAVRLIDRLAQYILATDGVGTEAYYTEAQDFLARERAAQEKP